MILIYIRIILEWYTGRVISDTNPKIPFEINPKPHPNPRHTYKERKKKKCSLTPKTGFELDTLQPEIEKDRKLILLFYTIIEN